MGLQVPGGSGKTYGALLPAYGLVKEWDKIVVTDSENHSADLFAHLGDYSIVQIGSPFSPAKYIEAIEVCKATGTEVIIIDSISTKSQCKSMQNPVNFAFAGFLIFIPCAKKYTGLKSRSTESGGYFL